LIADALDQFDAFFNTNFARFWFCIYVSGIKSPIVHLASQSSSHMSLTMSQAEQDVKLNNFPNIFRLDGKVAVVTGGSRGLGLHAASG
jgi:hypothetical protein